MWACVREHLGNDAEVMEGSEDQIFGTGSCRKLLGLYREAKSKKHHGPYHLSAYVGMEYKNF